MFCREEIETKYDGNISNMFIDLKWHFINFRYAIKEFQTIIKKARNFQLLTEILQLSKIASLLFYTIVLVLSDNDEPFATNTVIKWTKIYSPQIKAPVNFNDLFNKTTEYDFQIWSHYINTNF